MQKNTIVFVTNTVAVGGAAKVVSFVANSAAKVFKNVYIIVYDDQGSAHKLNSRIKIVHLNLKRTNKNDRIPFISSIINRYKWIRIIRHNIKMLKPDVIMPFITDVVIDTYLAMLGYKAKFIAAERGDPTSYPLIWKLLSKVIYPLYDKVIFQTEGAKQYFHKTIKKKSVIIENPYFSEVENTKSYQGFKEKCIVSAGRFAPEKDFESLIKAFKIINLNHPDYKLIIYGDGDLKESLQKLIIELNLSEIVELRGYVKNVSEYICDCDVFVLSSTSEGIPNILIEAMGIGMPVVSTDCKPGGAASLIRNGENGILVSRSNPNELAEAIEYLISDKEYAFELGKEALKVKEKLDPDIISEKWLNLFNSL